MNLSVNGSSTYKERRLNLSMLNPNAAEFVPSSLRSPSSNTNSNPNPNLKNPFSTSLRTAKSFNDATLDQSESSVFNTSEEESHQNWRLQLPDDITPDFGGTGEDQLHITGDLSFSSLSISDTSNRSSWGDKQFANGGRKYGVNGREVSAFNGGSSAISNPFTSEEPLPNHIKFLALKFPGFSSQSLADIYLKSGSDLALTMEILTEMENQNLKSKSVAPSSPFLYSQNALQKYVKEPGQALNTTYRSLSATTLRVDTDLPSPVRETTGQQWRYNGRDTSPAVIGSSRASNLTNIDLGFSDETASVWINGGDAPGNKYLESKEEVRNLSMLRNVCLEQARQAYLAGSDTLAKELNLKGQLYGIQLKAAQEKSKESIYQNRNTLLTEIQGYGTELPDRPIDLRGLHMSEAVHVLNFELNNRKRAARSAGRRIEVTVLIGPGGNLTRGGLRTSAVAMPARLTGAIEQYLLEQGFRCAQAQPGVLHVVIY